MRPAPAMTRETLAALVTAYAATGDLERAALACGLTVVQASRALREHGARQMMARAIRHELDVVTVPEAVAVLRAALRDPQARVRVDAAKTLLDRAGVVAKPEAAAAERNLSELSRDDLRALIDQLQAEDAERAAAPPRAAPDGPDYLD